MYTPEMYPQAPPFFQISKYATGNRGTGNAGVVAAAPPTFGVGEQPIIFVPQLLRPLPLHHVSSVFGIRSLKVHKGA